MSVIEWTPVRIIARLGSTALLGALLGTLLAACSPDTEQTADSGAATKTPDAEAGSRDRGPEAANSGALVAAGLLGRWNLVQIDGQPIHERLRGQAFLEFLDNGAVIGHSGVNRIQLQTGGDLSGGRIDFEQGLSTMMSGPPPAMEFERTYLDRLGTVSTFEISDGRLRLFAGDQLALELERSGT